MDFSPVLAMQLASVAATFLACLIGSIIPIRLTRCFTDQARVLSLSNCLGAGILLGASYVHLMTDAEDSTVSSYISDRLDHFLVAVGFLLSFIMEKVLFEHEHEHPGGGHSHGHRDEHVIRIENFEDEEQGMEMATTKHTSKKETGLAQSEKGEDAEGAVHTNEAEINGEAEVRKRQRGEKHEHTHSEKGDDGEGNESVEVKLQETADGHETLLLRHKHVEGDEHRDLIVERRHPRARKIPYTLFVVLGAEAGVSGCALGFQAELMDVVVLFIAIVSHIWAEAFTLCTALLKAKVSEATTLKAMTGFSLITPVCILLGIVLSKFLTQVWVGVVSSLLIALAAGTFIFVANMEIMVEEFSDPEGRWTKLSLLLVGFTFMSVLGFVV